MRVTFLVANYWPSVGGAQLDVQHVAEGLVARHGFSVGVVTTDALRSPGAVEPGHVGAAPTELNGVAIRRLPVARRTHDVVRTARMVRKRAGLRLRDSSIAAGPLGARLAMAAVRAARSSDVVVGVGSPFLTLWGADMGTRGTSCAHVVLPLLHLTKVDPPPWVVRSMARADGCAACTGFEQEWMVAHGVARQRTAVLPPGCDPERYPATGPAEARRRAGLPDGPTVGYVGRMAAHKGIDTLADAMELVWARRPEATLLLAGSHAGWQGFDDAVSRLRRTGGDRVAVRSPFADEDRPTLLSACDVVAFPSREESFGMVTVEAWCARRPVVAGDIAAVRSLVRPGVDGELVPVDRPDVLADAIADLLGDDARRDAYGRAGRHRAEQEFAWDGIVDRWASFLDDAVARRRAARRGDR